MTSLNESLLHDIDELDDVIYESEQSVIYEMARHCSKMMTFMEYSDNVEYIIEGFTFADIGRGIKHFVQWLFNTIIGFFKMIGRAISKTILAVKHFFTGKSAKDTRSIHEMVAEKDYPHHDRINITKRTVHVDMSNSPEEKSFDVNLYTEPLIVQMQEGEGFKIKFTKHIKNFILNSIQKNFGNIPSQFPSISFSTPISILLFKNKKHVMEYLENSIQILEAMFLKKIDIKENEKKFISQVNAIVTVANQYTTIKDYGFNCTLGELTQFQDKINMLLSHLHSESELISKAEDDPEFKLSKEAIKCVNFLFVLLTITQITINAVGISITNIYVIPEQYTSTINDFDKMGEFVNTMIENNIPSKYVMLNAWLAGTPEFTGNPGEYNEKAATTYSPAMGHGRGCFFPKDLTDSVYKIALNKRGTFDIANEYYVSNYTRNTRVASKFALIKRVNQYNTICEMEKLRTLSSNDTLKYGVKIDRIISKIKHELPFNVRDLHTLNFGIRLKPIPEIPNSQENELIISDYGALKFNNKFNKINKEEVDTNEQNRDGNIQ